MCTKSQRQTEIDRKKDRYRTETRERTESNRGRQKDTHTHRTGSERENRGNPSLNPYGSSN